MLLRNRGKVSEKSGRGFSRFYFRGIKASAEERERLSGLIPGRN